MHAITKSEVQVKLEILKNRWSYSTFPRRLTNKRHCYSSTNAFKLVFQHKPITRFSAKNPEAIYTDPYY